jgi:hypothetical protein
MNRNRDLMYDSVTSRLEFASGTAAGSFPPQSTLKA